MKYFKQAKIEDQDFKGYKNLVPKQYEEVIKLSENFSKPKIIHINTAFGSGGVAEILKCLVPLERSLGLESEWLIMQGTPEFFNVTKKIHNLLQGKEGSLSEDEKQTYLSYTKKASEELMKYLDKSSGEQIVILHDPQPLPMIMEIPDTIPVISRLHIDITNENKELGQLLKPFTDRAKKIIVSDKKFIADWIQADKVLISLPATDPFNEKNKLISKEDASVILKKIGIDTERPLVSQISRFDPWKDPEGVIEAYLAARKKIKGLQLVLAGLIVAEDDPEAQGIYDELKDKYGDDHDIHLYGEKTPPGGIENEEFINALQTGSDVVVQKSLREGFGLTVTEALWKGQPVIGGNVGGIKKQIVDGENGFLVSSPEECAERIVELISKLEEKERMGKNAKETVKNEFLMSRLILDHFKVYDELLKK
ncbi:MAG: hypothetical protein JWP09_363 [Candidatus Taylorbacteria bacterium]|nr:hypothetical protein [Candidatus Taylorbacteria bacterium]